MMDENILFKCRRENINIMGLSEYIRGFMMKTKVETLEDLSFLKEISEIIILSTDILSTLKLKRRKKHFHK